MTARLFAEPETTQKLRDAKVFLQQGQPDSLRYTLGRALGIVANNAELFDEQCQITIGWIGPHIVNSLTNLSAQTPQEDIDNLVSNFYRVIVEFDMAMKEALSFELSSFVEQVNEGIENLSGEAQRQIRYARDRMPAAMLKKMLNSDELGSLINVAKVAASVDERVKKWESDLQSSEKKAVTLAETLDKQAQAFNFVGLHEGFRDLADGLVKELKDARHGMVLFGVLASLPSCIDIALVIVRQVDLSKMSTQTLIAGLIGTLSATLLLLYFFRIALRKADSCQAQLVQVRLRMSLCRFIQSYADYSEKFKTKNADALAKFESLIFSGIVGTEDRLPSTFDGIEQLASLAKSIRGKE